MPASRDRGRRALGAGSGRWRHRVGAIAYSIRPSHLFSIPCSAVSFWYAGGVCHFPRLKNYHLALNTRAQNSCASVRQAPPPIFFPTSSSLSANVHETNFYIHTNARALPRSSRLSPPPQKPKRAAPNQAASLLAPVPVSRIYEKIPPVSRFQFFSASGFRGVHG